MLRAPVLVWAWKPVGAELLGGQGSLLHPPPTMGAILLRERWCVVLGVFVGSVRHVRKRQKETEETKEATSFFWDTRVAYFVETFFLRNNLSHIDEPHNQLNTNALDQQDHTSQPRHSPFRVVGDER